MTSEEAIAFIEQCRQTHVDWAEYLRSGASSSGTDPDPEPQGNVGGVGHHEECIAGYDGVLELLRGTP